MLKQRVLTAALGLPLLLTILIYSPPIFVCLVFLLCVGLSVFELGRMLHPAFSRKFFPTDPQGLRDSRTWAAFSVLAGCLMFSLSTIPNLSGSTSGGIVAVISMVILVGTFSANSIEQSIIRVTCVLASLCYACLPWLTIWDLYLMGPQARFLLLLLSIVMMGDTGAYFAGRYFGKRLLAPRYSPKKTWEGVIGGLFSSTLGVLVVNFCFSGSLGPWWLMVTLALLGGSAGVLGDLVESAFKRFAEVKDSGGVFPGHGGFLDRVDSILFAAPICWLILYTHQSFSN